MIRPLLILAAVLYSSVAFSKEMIFYKYAEGDGTYSTLVSSLDEALPDPSARNVIARKLVGTKFLLESVPLEYYQIRVTPGLAFFGDTFSQYEITPLVNDRFSHVVWVDDNGILIKTEIFDNNKNLLFAFSSIDFTKPFESSDNKKNNKHMSNLLSKPFFKGFSHVFTKLLPDGVVHMVFLDGLNRFSVFINPNPTETGTVTKIAYGNYLLSKVLSGTEYTIVGSVPYETMEEFIIVLDKSKAAIRKAIENGETLTDGLLYKGSKVESNLEEK